MTSLSITDASIPDLSGKVAIVTGGSYGIGFGAVEVLRDHGASVYILDISSPPKEHLGPNVHFLEADIRSWRSLVLAFSAIKRNNATIDMVVANAGTAEDGTFLSSCLQAAPQDDAGWEDLASQTLTCFGVVDVNLRGTMQVILLASRIMRSQAGGGSIVVTTSATAYLPEQSIPVYCATKGALTTLIRTLRSTLPLYGIQISGVAPSATVSVSVPQHFLEPLVSAGLPISSARHVGLALVYSLTAKQKSPVEFYGKDEKPTGSTLPEIPWNGRVIHTIGDKFYEVEEGLIDTRGDWWGVENETLTQAQQSLTDFRMPQSLPS